MLYTKHKLLFFWGEKTGTISANLQKNFIYISHGHVRILREMTCLKNESILQSLNVYLLRSKMSGDYKGNGATCVEYSFI
jgi:hypothetical protein